MSDYVIFIGLLLAVIFAYVSWRLPPSKWPEYFRTREGRGILKGIVLAPVAILLIAAVLWLLPSSANAQSGTWLNDAGVFIGLDYTRKQSPQCEVSDIDDRGTSNLGARLNIWQSASKNVRLNTKYTHHSCALGVDRNGYDALGVELEWTLWKR